MTETALRAHTAVAVDDLITAAAELARSGRSETALALLDAASTEAPEHRARLALAAAEAALDAGWFKGFDAATTRLGEAAAVAGDLTADARWDLDFLRLRHDYARTVLGDGGFRPGPDGKDPEEMTGLRARAGELRDLAPDLRRRGWVHHYLGLISDNVFGEAAAAPADYEAALAAGEESADDLLTREALRHLGDHAHTRGDHALALELWRRATFLGARAGNVPGTLSQQMLLAVSARDTGDEAGARALAREVARWAEALGARRLADMANGFLGGQDPTAEPES
ncbi:hypothetical protein AB0I28_00540 [Phytomonospora sp. NPDC050363]|uniref:hypothetical protein n=1 Tax=Phytomonospora sp. NPDC050363 TaxID=3155642 RepID=UPI0033C55C96